MSSGLYLRPVKMGDGFSIGGSETAGESFQEFSLEGVECRDKVYPPYPGDPENDWPVLLYEVPHTRTRMGMGNGVGEREATASPLHTSASTTGAHALSLSRALQVVFKRAWQPYTRGYIALNARRKAPDSHAPLGIQTHTLPSLPQVVLNFIGFLCFSVPPQCGERLGLGITAASLLLLFLGCAEGEQAS